MGAAVVRASNVELEVVVVVGQTANFLVEMRDPIAKQVLNLFNSGGNRL